MPCLTQFNHLILPIGWSVLVFIDFHKFPYFFILHSILIKRFSVIQNFHLENDFP